MPSNKLKRSQSDESETTSNQRRAPRFKAELHVRLAKVLQERFGEEPLSGQEISGYTRDLSKIGLAIILSDARAKLTDFKDSKLGFFTWIDLPAETVKMRIVPVRAEKLLAGSAKGHLLIGAHIRVISEIDRVSLHRYLETLQQ